ncbi:MAG: NusA-like transcription termination signal-binding factor [Candidatus Aenigmatarchaeota archaeon]
MRAFDNDTIQLISAFERITRSRVHDCLKTETEDGPVILFVIDKGAMGKAIGKNGENIRNAEDAMGCMIKVFEYSEDEAEFVKNLVPSAKSVGVKDGKALIKAARRGAVIGKGGENIKILKQILERNSSIKEIEVR